MTALTIDKRSKIRQRQIRYRQLMIHMMMVVMMLPVLLAGTPDLSLAATTVSEHIRASKTWDLSGSPYIVTNEVFVCDNAKLTIVAGVVVKFNAGASLKIGYSSTSWGALSAVGEQDNHIVFTSNVSPQNPGDWKGIYFTSATSSTTQLNYCTIEYGGHTNNANLYLANSAAFSISEVIVQKSSGHGIYISYSNPVISNCRIIDNQSDGIYCDNGEGSTVYTTTIADNLFVNNGGAAINTRGYINSITGSQGYDNGVNGISVRSGYIRGDCTWSAQDLPFVVQGDVSIINNKKLTITPGAIIKFNAGAGLRIGYSSTSWGALSAVGEQDNHIVFTSNVSPQNPGDWKGIYFTSSTSSTTQLNYCTIEYGGHTNNANLYLGSSPAAFSIGDTTEGEVIVQKSSGYGIYIGASNPIISNCRIIDNQSDGIYCDNGEGSTVYTTTIADNLFVNNGGAAINTRGYINSITGSQGYDNGVNGISVRSGYIRGDCTWSAQDLPFVVQGDVSIINNKKLTITPGAIIKFNAGAGLKIGYSSTSWGALSAVGEQDKHIVFTSNVSPQNPGDWKGIYFTSSTSSTTQLNYCTIEYGGHTNNANLYLSNVASTVPTIQNSDIRASSDSGIYIATSSPVISCNNIMENVEGIHYEYGSATPTIENNNILENTGMEFYAGTAVTIGSNWWGPSGDPGIVEISDNVTYGVLAEIACNTGVVVDNPPYPPAKPSPADGAGVAIYENGELIDFTTLSWSCTDYNPADTPDLNFDVYFGTNPDALPEVSSEQTDNAYTVANSGLSLNTTYYWKIVARDSQDSLGRIISGPVWSFTTSGYAPARVTNLSIDGVGDGKSAVLDWDGYTDPLNTVIDRFEIYQYGSTFDKLDYEDPVADPVKVGQVEGDVFTYQAVDLQRGNTYYFAVVPVDEFNNYYTDGLTSVTGTLTDEQAPGEVTDITVVSGANQLTFNWTAPGDDDLAGYEIYFDDAEVPATIDVNDPNSTSYTVDDTMDPDIVPASTYTFKIIIVDDASNKSEGLEINAATLVANPAAPDTVANDGYVSLSWDEPDSYARGIASPIKRYVVYKSETDAITSLNQMTWALTTTSTSANVAGLTNGQNYYFAVATVNISGCKDDAVNLSGAVVPLADDIDPTIGELQFNGTTFNEVNPLTGSGDFELTATDASGISRVEFVVLDGSNDEVFRTTDYSPVYTCNMDLLAFHNQSYTLQVTVYDTIGNEAFLEYPFTVAMPAPAVPVINSPVDGFSTNQSAITVKGTAEPLSTITFYVNGTEQQTTTTTNASGNFSGSVDLVKGTSDITTNNINATATAANRPQTSGHSTTITGYLDTSIPDAPVHLTAEPLEGGKVHLTWDCMASDLAGYNIYRHTASFETATAAIRVNSSPVKVLQFTNAPEVEGLYYYSVTSVNSLGTESALSNQVEAQSDASGPEVDITYTPQGPVSPVDGAIGPGRVDVTLVVNEPLLTTPFFSMVPDGGVLIPVDLTKISDTEYSGYFTIEADTISAETYAVFSARDRVGNRGTTVPAEDQSILVDARGPEVIRLDVTPAAPIDNNGPVTVTAVFGLDEPIPQSDDHDYPVFEWELSGAPGSSYPTNTAVEIDPQPEEAQAWRVSFTIPAMAVSADYEYLSFSLEGIDYLGNIGDTISADNAFEIYQGNLPKLDPPTSLTGTSLPYGDIELSWDAVDNASGYKLYRGTTTGDLTEIYEAPAGITTYTDTNQPGDGDYFYAITSIREENSLSSESVQRVLTQSVSSDSALPLAPANLSLELVPNGIQATWEYSAADQVTYSLYRSLNSISSVDGLEPIIQGISMANISVIDPNPSETDHYYVVVAVDDAGNISPLSNNDDLDPGLLPVTSLNIVQEDLSDPVISWTTTGSSIVGCNIYMGEASNDDPLNDTLITTNTYTDTGYAEDQRTYTVTTENNSGTESLDRVITLPKVTAVRAADARIDRGIMNGLTYTVTNHSSDDIDPIQLQVDVVLEDDSEKSHLSTPFALAAGETRDVSVIIGGYENLLDNTEITTTIKITEDVNETIDIIRTGYIDVGDGLLGLRLTTETFTRGGDGQVRFSLENTCAEEIEIISARNFGDDPSDQVVIFLEDFEGNPVATRSYKCAIAPSVTQTDGTSVISIPPGQTFESELITIPVPANASDDLIARLSIAHIYYHFNDPDQVEMGEMSTSLPVSLVDTSYYGEVTSVSPANSSGDTDITISGHAMERGTGDVLSGVPLTVVITNNGFERKATVYTDQSGCFEYLYTPTIGSSGTFQVCAVHPDLTERPVQGTFVINQINLQYSAYNLTLPRGLAYDVTLAATAGSGTAATSLGFEYRAQDQDGGVFPAGITVTPGTFIDLDSGESAPVSFTIEGDLSAADTSRIVLRLVSSEEPTNGWDTLEVNLSLVESRPSLWTTPDYLMTGMNTGDYITESVVLENKGYADMESLSLSLINSDGSAVPDWIYISSPTRISSLAAGATSNVSIVLSPPADFAPDVLYLYLKITSGNHADVKIPISVTVTTDVTGQVLFHVSDFYTGTPDDYNEPINGLANARILVQNEATFDEYTLTTDTEGEAQSPPIPVGNYRVRVRADNHQELVDRIWIKPGITLAKEIFLANQLVTVEWEVVETTIADKYEIIYTATFETDVPAAIVVSEPPVIEIPDGMKVGDVANGEVKLTNKGLIRAEDIDLPAPVCEYFQVEYIGVPESIQPHQSVSVPYRITCLKLPYADAGQDGTGGDTESEYDEETCSEKIRKCNKGYYTFTCSNGTTFKKEFESCVDYTEHYPRNPDGSCDWTTDSNNTDKSEAADDLIEQDQKEFEKEMQELMDSGELAAMCAGETDGCEDDDDDDDFCDKFEKDHNLDETGSAVDLLNFMYTRDDTDLSLQVPGGLFEMTRQYKDGQWDWGLSKKNLTLNYEDDQIASIDKNGIIFRKVPESPSDVKALFTNTSYKITQQMDDTFVWQSRGGNYKFYDAQGRLTEVGDANGPQRYLIYSGQYLIGYKDKDDQQFLWLEYTGNQILRIQDNNNREVQYDYTVDGLLETVTFVNDLSESKVIYGYGYDDVGNLTSVWLAGDGEVDIQNDDPTYTITYNELNMAKSVVDSTGQGKYFSYNYFSERKERYASSETSDGQIKEIWYDDEGNAKRMDINGETQFAIEIDGRTTRITRNGHTTSNYYDEWDNEIKREFPDGSSITREFERKFSKMTSKTDENGVVTEYTYDDKGNRTSMTEAVGTPEERTTEYEYEDGNLIETRILGVTDIVTTMTYDDDGNQTSITTDAEGDAVKTAFIHDIMGNVLTRTVDPDGVNLVWTYTYDDRGNMLSVEDPEHRLTQYEYDLGGRKTKQIAPDLTETLYEYDSVGNMIKQTVVMSPENIVTTFEYGYDNKLLKTIDPEGAVTEYVYDSRGRRVKTIDPAGNATITAYDPIDSGGCTSCSGSAGQPIRITYPTYEKAFVYDERNRKIAEKVITAEQTFETLFVYDPVGNLIEKTDKDNQTTYYEYDALNRLIRVTDPNQGQTSYTYDNRDNMTSLTDAQGNTTEFEYDANNRLVKETRPEGEITTYDYDLMGNLIEKIDAKDQKTEYDYNNAGQLDETRYYDASLTLVKTVSFTYDDAGNLEGYNDGTTSAVYVFDKAGRKTSETVTCGGYSWTNTYTYLKNGLKDTFTGPDNVTYTYMYDTANRLAGVQMPAGVGFLTVNGYNWNRPAGFTLPGGGARETLYDPLMRIKQIIGKDPGGNDLLNYDYTYDTMDNITSKATEHGDYNYDYDNLHRLVDVDNPEVAGLADEEFTYDNVGNRLTTEDSTSDWGYNSNNELQSSSDTTGNAVYEYDDNGNTIKKTVAGVVTNYVYNVEDRLTEVRDGSNNLIASYYYDPFGRRLSKIVGGTKTYYHYSDEGLVAEIDSYGNVVKSYGWQPGGTWGTDPLFMRVGGAYYFYHNDHLGTPQKLTAANGAVVWSAKYSSFGEAVVEVDTVENNLRFPGQYFDSETGLHYNMWRYYDPEMGRFLRKDPVGLRGGVNLFLYALNNSVNNEDPFGLITLVADIPEDPNANTVVCDGKGGTRIQVTETDECIKSCVEAHEQKHKEDIDQWDPDVCKRGGNKPDGTRIVIPDITYRRLSEITARNRQLVCLHEKLKCPDDGCFETIQKEIKIKERQAQQLMNGTLPL